MRCRIYRSLTVLLLCFAVRTATVGGQPTVPVAEIESATSRGEYLVLEASLLSGFCPTEELVEDWVTSEWEPDRITRSSCDEQGNQIESVMQIWEEGGWADGSRVYRYYDAAGNLLEWVSQEWDGFEWINYTRRTSIYDENGNRTESLLQRWGGAQWVNSSRTTDYYDSSGSWTEGYNETWDGESWVYYSMSTGAYDQFGNLTLWLVRLWREGQWTDGFQWAYSFDDFGNLLEGVSQVWDGVEWINSSRQTIIFDDSGREAQWVDYSWSEDDGWVPVRLWDHSYDSNGNMVELLVMVWQQDDWVNYTRHTYLWNAIGVGKENPTHNPGAVSKHTLSQNYPNPFRPSTTISFALPHATNVTLNVYDVLGRQIRELASGAKPAGTYEATFDATGVPSGVYLYRLQAGDYVETKRMVVVR